MGITTKQVYAAYSNNEILQHAVWYGYVKVDLAVNSQM
jgi:hypothetical protein